MLIILKRFKRESSACNCSFVLSGVSFSSFFLLLKCILFSSSLSSSVVRLCKNKRLLREKHILQDAVMFCQTQCANWILRPSPVLASLICHWQQNCSSGYHIPLYYGLLCSTFSSSPFLLLIFVPFSGSSPSLH